MNEGNTVTIREILEKESSAFILLRFDKNLKFQIIDSYTNEVLESALNWQLFALNGRKQNQAGIIH